MIQIARATGPSCSLDALLHLLRRLVRERDREDLVRLDADRGEQVRDAIGEHARLARARAGDHEQRALGGQHGLPLGGVQVGEVGLGLATGIAGHVRIMRSSPRAPLRASALAPRERLGVGRLEHDLDLRPVCREARIRADAARPASAPVACTSAVRSATRGSHSGGARPDRPVGARARPRRGRTSPPSRSGGPGSTQAFPSWNPGAPPSGFSSGRAPREAPPTAPRIRRRRGTAPADRRRARHGPAADAEGDRERLAGDVVGRPAEPAGDDEVVDAGAARAERSRRSAQPRPARPR